MLRTLALCLLLTLAACLGQGVSPGSEEEAFNTLTDIRTYATSYGGPGTDRPHDIAQTADLGFIVVGETGSVTPPDTDAWAMKQDSDGNVVWSNAYSCADTLPDGTYGWETTVNGALDSNHIDVVGTTDGGFVLAGAIFDGVSAIDGGPLFRLALAKLDANGRLLWSRTYGPRLGRFLDLEPTADGGFVAVGYEEDLEARVRDVVVVKLDTDGIEQWRVGDQDATDAVATCVKQAADGHYVVAGIVEIDGENQGFIQKLDATTRGPIWRNGWDDGEGVQMFDLEVAVDGLSYTVVGGVTDNKSESYPNPINSYDFLVSSVRDSDGEKLETRRHEIDSMFVTPEYAFSVARFGVGWAVAGRGARNDHAGLIFELNPDLELLGEHFHGEVNAETPSSEEIQDIYRLADDSYLIAGVRRAGGAERAWVSHIGSCLDVVFWERTYDLGGDAIAYSIAEAPNGFVVTGAGPVGGWALRLDRDGNVLWRRTVAGGSHRVAYSVQQTDDDGDGLRDDGYVMAGSYREGDGNSDAWVLKLDPNGELEWQIVVGGPHDDHAARVIVARDGNYVVAGTLGGTADAAGFVFEVTPLGDLGWSESFGAPGTDEACYGLCQAADDGFVVAGDGWGGAFALKLAANGRPDPGWGPPRLFAGASARDLAGTGDGDYVVAGSRGAGRSADYWAVRLDAGGTVVAEAVFGPAPARDTEDRVFGVTATHDGGCAIAGYTRSFGGGLQCEADDGGTDVLCANIWVLRLDAGLAIDWQRTYSTQTEDKAYAIRSTADCGFIVAGETDARFAANEEERGFDAWILKTFSDGTISIDCPAGIAETTGAARTALGPQTQLGPDPAPGDVVPNAADTRCVAFPWIDLLTVDTLCFTDLVEFEVTIQVAGQGRVTSTPAIIDCRATCTLILGQDTKLQLAAVPDEGWVFVGFSPECPDGRLVVDRAKTCTAVFAAADEEPPPSAFAGTWDELYVCSESCEEGGNRDVNLERTTRIDVDGADVTITYVGLGVVLQGTLAGDVITFTDQEYVIDGVTYTESGTFTLLEGGTSFVRDSSYRAVGGGDDCIATCEGSGHLQE